MSSIVYVLSNEAMPGLLKIGKTSSDDPLQRMGQLYTTGVPLPFECEFAVAVPDEQADVLEQALHRAFEDHRLNPKREFFRMPLARVVAILGVWPGAEDVTDTAKQDLDAEVGQGELDAVKRERKRRPRLDLAALGIKAGDTLDFTGDDDATVVVVDAGRQMVSLNGSTVHLRDATYSLAEKEPGTPIRQAAYWAFDGRGLVELYEELHAENLREKVAVYDAMIDDGTANHAHKAHRTRCVNELAGDA